MTQPVHCGRSGANVSSRAKGSRNATCHTLAPDPRLKSCGLTSCPLPDRMSTSKSPGRKAQHGLSPCTTRGLRPTWEVMGIVLGHDAKDAACARPAVVVLHLAHTGIAQLNWALLTSIMKQPYKPLTSKSFRSASKVGKAGRKRHGSHRSKLIGQYQFTSSPVVSLHQAGVIWTSV